MPENDKGSMRIRRRTARMTPDDMARKGFERLVAETIAGLPPEIKRRMENIDVIVEDEPSKNVLTEEGMGPEESLYGYYQGVPHHRRGTWYSMVLPDKISIYRRPILADCRNGREVRQLVRSTVIHEVAHHFGLDDDALERLGWE